MAEQSGIAWTTSTWNPWWGCTEVSPACDNCYARVLAHRYGYGWGAEAERRFFGAKHWQEPVKWNARAAATGGPWRVFCASMADVFERLPQAHPQREQMDVEREAIWRMVEKTPSLTWMLLTKRPQNILRMVPSGWLSGFPPNVWVGVTAEDQEWLERRWRRLRQVPARVRFISYEPALGPIDLTRVRHERPGRFMDILYGDYGNGAGEVYAPCPSAQWVIIGTESGPKRRPMPLEWAERVVEQCRGAGVAAFVKQIQPNGLVMHDTADFPPFLRVRQFPEGVL